jgi:hypothetical protein
MLQHVNSADTDEALGTLYLTMFDIACAMGDHLFSLLEVAAGLAR